MIRTLLRTDRSWAPLSLRLGLGGTAVLLGIPHLLGVGMAEGRSSLAELLASALDVPVVLAVPVIVTLLLGGVLLILGWCVRITACLLTLAMVTRVCSEAWFLPADQVMPFASERFGFHVLAVAAGIALMITGGGALALDRLVAQGPAPD